MKHLILSLCLILSAPLFAQRANVVIVDPDIETDELENNFNVQRPRHANSLPDKFTRDEILEGIEAVQGWDELKKDIFFMDLRSKPLAELKKKYPQVSEKKLKVLQEKVK